jgi:hypothetical protein
MSNTAAEELLAISTRRARGHSALTARIGWDTATAIYSLLDKLVPTMEAILSSTEMQAQWDLWLEEAGPIASSVALRVINHIREEEWKLVEFVQSMFNNRI